MLIAGLFLVGLAACGGGSSSAGDIETWLIEVGNDFPDEAKCVAEEMKDYSVSDFENSFDGNDLDEEFERKLDAVYEMCDAALGITTEE